jgi:uncharacterized protein (DUF885 family)
MLLAWRRAFRRLWRLGMRWHCKLLVSASALLAAGFSYIAYTTLWGTPLWFDGLLDRQAVLIALQQPEILTQFGLAGADWFDINGGELGGYSLAGRSGNYLQLRRFRSEIMQWNRAKLSRDERTAHDMLLWSYDRRLADEKYPWLGADGELYPVNQAFGVQKFLPSFLLNEHQITSARSAQNYVSRLRAIGPLLDALRADIQRQATLGVVAPDFIIDDSIAQMNELIAAPPERNVLVTNLAEKSATIGLDPTSRLSLVRAAAAALKDIVYPAYCRLIAEERVLRASASHDAGLWRLKDGEAYYADQLKFLTSTDMTPGEIYKYAQSEVNRISAQMDTVLKSMALRDGTIGARMEILAAESRFHYPDTEDGRRQMLIRYKQILRHMKTLVPGYFAHVPTIELDVRRMPAFTERGAAGAYYDAPSLDGSRPGVFFANMRDPSEVPMWAMPTLAYHEGIPGHHLQTATAFENSQLPILRRMQFSPAYDEGWALYSETLADEMGLYKNDPYGELGRLQSELFRVTRLVVDTGIHARHWSRERAIDYMESATGMAHSEVVAEVDRDVVWPAQVCAYSIGLKVIRDLRAQATAALGASFDLKAFHAQILENGAVPLWLLQREIDGWISELKRHRDNSPTSLAINADPHA